MRIEDEVLSEGGSEGWEEGNACSKEGSEEGSPAFKKWMIFINLKKVSTILKNNVLLRTKV